MGCKSYQSDGTCKHFPNEKCPVEKYVRDMFGEMDMCKPVRNKMEMTT